VWFLIGAIGCSLLSVVAFGWGLAKGAELSRKGQARLSEAARKTIDEALACHAREHAAWQAAQRASPAASARPLSSWADSGLHAPTRLEQRSQRGLHDEALEAAELAHLATDDLLDSLRELWADPDEPAEAAKLRAEQRARKRDAEAAQRRAARDRQDRADDEPHGRLLS
jgi:hypothetical protein